MMGYPRDENFTIRTGRECDAADPDWPIGNIG
jgi:hypothetical protein